MPIPTKGFWFAILVSASTLCYSTPVSTYRSRVLKEVEALQKDYKKKCTGAGWIEVKQVPLADLELKIQSHRLSQHRATYESDLQNLVEECVLLWRGVNGPVLTRSARATLAETVGSHLWTLLQEERTPTKLLSGELLPYGFWYNPTHSSTYSTGSDILNSACSLVIPLGQGLALQLDGHGTD